MCGMTGFFFSCLCSIFPLSFSVSQIYKLTQVSVTLHSVGGDRKEAGERSHLSCVIMGIPLSGSHTSTLRASRVPC